MINQNELDRISNRAKQSVGIVDNVYMMPIVPNMDYQRILGYAWSKKDISFSGLESAIADYDYLFDDERQQLRQRLRDTFEIDVEEYIGSQDDNDFLQNEINTFIEDHLLNISYNFSKLANEVSALELEWLAQLNPAITSVEMGQVLCQFVPFSDIGLFDKIINYSDFKSYLSNKYRLSSEPGYNDAKAFLESVSPDLPVALTDNKFETIEKAKKLFSETDIETLLSTYRQFTNIEITTIGNQYLAVME
mgnify:FL=1